LRDFEFDVVLASQHGVDGLEDYYWVNMALEDEKKLFDDYFDTLLRLVHWNGFDVLAHLTYPVRYYFRDNRRLPDLTPYEDKIDAVLRILAYNGKALEINLSGLAKEMNTSMPDLFILKRFKALGGEKITIGTDDHNAETIKYLPERGLVLAYEAGFRHFTVYDKRIPTLVRFAD